MIEKIDLMNHCRSTFYDDTVCDELTKLRILSCSCFSDMDFTVPPLTPLHDEKGISTATTTTTTATITTAIDQFDSFKDTAALDNCFEKYVYEMSKIYKILSVRRLLPFKEDDVKDRKIIENFRAREYDVYVSYIWKNGFSEKISYMKKLKLCSSHNEGQFISSRQFR